jgi:hypothetical protein
MDSAVGRVFSTIRAALEAARCAERRPIRTARRLNGAVREITAASLRLIDARRELAEACAALDREPDQQRGEAPELMEMATARCEAVANSIPIAVEQVVLAQLEVLGGLYTGELVAEPADRRRIVPPRPLFVRAFLASRQPRVSDRIAPILLRRRRTPRPAEVRVPRRNLRGRAPPLSSTCAL